MCKQSNIARTCILIKLYILEIELHRFNNGNLTLQESWMPKVVFDDSLKQRLIIEFTMFEKQMIIVLVICYSNYTY